MLARWSQAYQGLRLIEVERIVGSVRRHREFDRSYLPESAGSQTRWKRIDRAFHGCEDLPPVSLYEVGAEAEDFHGRLRVWVARYHGVEWIDAEVTEFDAGSWSDPRDKGDLIEAPRRKGGGEPKLHERMDLQSWKQRREEMMRDVELNRLAKRLRAARKVHASGTSLLAWELKRGADRLLKFLRALKGIS